VVVFKQGIKVIIDLIIANMLVTIKEIWEAIIRI